VIFAAAVVTTALSNSTIALIVILGGFVATPVTSLIKHENWPAPVAQVIGMVVSAGVAAAAVSIDQPSLLSGRTIAALAGLVFSWATLVYPLVFKTSDVGRAVNRALTAVGTPKGKHAAK
jgi:small ligand-binding sensory domain FIST